MIKSSFLVLSMVLLCGSALARPVSYPGGWTVMTDNDNDENSALVHYTIDRDTAVGFRYDYDRNAKNSLYGIQMNNLLKRWNNPDSQANIYLKSAVGVIDDGGAEAFTGLQTDWENRRYMVMYENRISISDDRDRQKFMQHAGFGVAPYVAEFGSLHTWAMMHILHRPEDDQNIQFQPMLRFFKGEYLLEAGYNLTQKTPTLNGIIRF